MCYVLLNTHEKLGADVNLKKVLGEGMSNKCLFLLRQLYPSNLNRGKDKD